MEEVRKEQNVSLNAMRSVYCHVCGRQLLQISGSFEMEINCMKCKNSLHISGEGTVIRMEAIVSDRSTAKISSCRR